MLENSRIRLRAIEPSDLDFFCKIENDMDLWKFSSRREPYSVYAISRYVKDPDKNIFDRGQLRFVIERKNDRVVLGAIDMFNYDHCARRSEVGIVIDKPYRQNGFGKDSLMLLAEYAMKILDIHQLYAVVAVDNNAAVRSFLDAGFEKCGLAKDWIYFSNRYISAYFMQKILS